MTVDLSVTGLRIPLIPLGTRVRGVQVVTLPPNAIGLVAVHIGGGDAIPVALLGQVIPMSSTAGLSLDNNNPGTFPAGTLLTFIAQYDP